MIVVLQGIGLLFTLMTSFLGMLYILKGDIIISALVALTLVTLFYFLIEFMMERKGVLTKRKVSPLSLLLWSLFVILSIPLSYLLIHSLNVEINAKVETQKAFRQKLESLQDMTYEYDKQVDVYLTDIRTAYRKIAAQYVNDRGLQSAKDALMNKPLMLEQEHLNNLDNNNYTQFIDSVVARFIEVKFEEPKALADSTIDAFVQNRSIVVDNWNRLSVNLVIGELDNLYSQTIGDLSRSFKEHHHEGKPFEYEEYKFTTRLGEPSFLWGKYRPYNLLIPVFFMVFLLILPYYLVAKVEYDPKINKREDPYEMK